MLFSMSKDTRRGIAEHSPLSSRALSINRSIYIRSQIYRSSGQLLQIFNLVSDESVLNIDTDVLYNMLTGDIGSGGLPL